MTVPHVMRTPDTLQIRDLHLLAEFCVVRDDGIAEVSDLSTMATFFAQGDRDRAKLLPPYFVGKIIKIGREMLTADGNGIVSSCLAEFNSECRGWHYGWIGSRFKTSVSHVLAVHILLPSRRRGQPQTAGLRLAATFYSPSFSVVSLRRKGQSAVPEGDNNEGNALSFACLSLIIAAVGADEYGAVESPYHLTSRGVYNFALCGPL